jgi:hypothetical protein
MVQRAVRWLGMTPAERAAHDEEQRRQRQARLERRTSVRTAGLSSLEL